MSPLFKLPVIFSGLCLLCLFCCVCSASGETAFILDVEPANVKWSRLSYKAKSIFGKVKTDVQAQIVRVEDISPLLMTDPAGEALQPSGETAIALTINSNIEPLFGTDEVLNTKSWFNPNGVGALQRVRLRQGKDKWLKSYRFTKTGVFRLRKKPQDSREENLPFEQWTKIRNHFYVYGDKGLECSQILESGSLLYFVSAIDLTMIQNPLSLCVFNKKQLHRVKVSIAGAQNFKVKYLEKRGNSHTQIDKKIDTVKISFQPKSMAPANSAPEAFSFLGLKGDFEIYLAKSSGIPVRVSGRTSIFGRIVLHLQKVHLPP